MSEIKINLPTNRLENNNRRKKNHETNFKPLEVGEILICNHYLT